MTTKTIVSELWTLWETYPNSGQDFQKRYSRLKIEVEPLLRQADYQASYYSRNKERMKANKGSRKLKVFGDHVKKELV